MSRLPNLLKVFYSGKRVNPQALFFCLVRREDLLRDVEQDAMNIHDALRLVELPSPNQLPAGMPHQWVGAYNRAYASTNVSPLEAFARALRAAS